MLIPILIVAAFCFLLERLVPGWQLPKVRTWPVRVVLVNFVQVGVVLLAGVTWERWLSGASVFHLGNRMPAAAGGALAYFLATFVFYWWHRLRHTNDWLWRHFHQIHHSPQRLEVITSFYKHPVEMCVNSVIGSLLVYTLLGLSPAGAAIYTLCTALGEFFYHTNVKTPRWVGYVFQRPEMHRIHHQRDLHKNNYGDIPWWDMLFGTYDNPETFAGTCGFAPELEERLFPMLAFNDVHKALSLALLVLPFGDAARACTSFRANGESRHVLLAKNYDWAIGQGYVVAMPKGMRSVAVGAPFSWESRYASLGFTQFGVGLTISGMNEKGLAIETLLNVTGTLTETPDSGKKPRLISLQWVQYELDTAASVDEVVKSLDQVDLVQALLAVHFMVCDASGACAVIESGDHGEPHVSLRASGGDQAVLANRDWSVDAGDVKLGRDGGPRFSLARSSVARFSEASAALAGRHGPDMDVDAAFDLLEDVRMIFLTRWQIVWDLSDRKAYWLNRDGSRSEARYASFDFATDKPVCGGTILAARVGSGSPKASTLAPMNRAAIDAALGKLFDRSMELIRLRMGGSGAAVKELSRNVKALREVPSCP